MNNIADPSDTQTVPLSFDTEGATPMMMQFLEIKEQYQDCLLFYRMGDFYELFFDDAVKAAEALDIALTKRGKHQGNEIPMAGVPVHSHETYLQRLIRKGFRVAVCEQMEDPAEAKKRGAKSVVKRGVVRLITPGTLTEDSLLDARRHNYLAAVSEVRGKVGLAWLDMSTGDFYVQPCDMGGLPAALARLDAGELLISDKLLNRSEMFDIYAEYKNVITPQPASRFDAENAQLRLKKLYEVAALDAFGGFEIAELSAAGALIDYVDLTQKGQMPRLAPPQRMAAGAAMEIDAATRRSLELTQTQSGERKGSLLSVIDRTRTGAGARLLAARLSAPLTDAGTINKRLDLVYYFHDRDALRSDLRAALGECPDIERALSRLSVGRGGPRDLAAMRDGLACAFAIGNLLHKPDGGNDGLTAQPAALIDHLTDMGHHGDLVDLLRRSLSENLPLLARDGGFIAGGYHPPLDELRMLSSESKKLIANLQARYTEQTAITSLKVKHNNVLGYFIEVPAKQADRMMEIDEFIHRQTMANAVRFTTVELSELESKVSKAGDQALALELELFDSLVTGVLEHADAIARCAQALAGLDVSAALAELARDQVCIRPTIDDSLAFDIRGGRHPVVEAALRENGDSPFVANDCRLEGEQSLWLITGPNMAGKSTFLRQNALIAVLAQIGAFVPAETAHIGVIDRLFSRVGAADDLARGRSTFMVEMVETAAILNQASDRSLVILDEIGRGTATFDGLSIAWAVVENLHEVNKCRGLFATHYHELTALAAKLAHLSCHTMLIKEWQGEVVFLHEVGAGSADRSYGIHVAQLAGLPKPVIKRAEQVLKTLEKGEQSGAVSKLADDLPLFAAAIEQVKQEEKAKTPALSPEQKALLDAVAEIDPDNMTPREALDALYRLRAIRG
ncbi:DNA mismatch repair protein MutS [Thalassospira xiamenensis M-5 = DSM 17429]|uniref:DNA mismatch repair protein MutS n=1 Tax=Thalassospira xiamenensis M-5 = DSM 17429 TaxID=1123366 RepID=A0AB72UIV6_9PROT|nr:DNA mismatch repair protein MutS [Thalassospira xiamenensis]AJD54074.1 DNA mismatch repair protein MutS [Thalassospira xiamenensis M-5 = DSM 17429]SIS61886.1 DNA mismatch repair protein MutS [Thalassospira xiamenensis M-5 = DSM 17429]